MRVPIHRRNPRECGRERSDANVPIVARLNESTANRFPRLLYASTKTVICRLCVRKRCGIDGRGYTKVGATSASYTPLLLGKQPFANYDDFHSLPVVSLQRPSYRERAQLAIFLCFFADYVARHRTISETLAHFQRRLTDATCTQQISCSYWSISVVVPLHGLQSRSTSRSHIITRPAAAALSLL